jgi:ATP-dependent DNA helicase RecQ
MDSNDALRISSERLHEELAAHFGFPAFRPGQEAVIGAAVSGHNVLGVMPTGAGKSLCYQLTSLLRPGGTLVISPLIALMKDQADSIANVAGLRVGLLNSSISRAAQERALRDWEDGSLDLLYAAPERFRNRRFLDALVKRRPAVLAVDEAHCVSQWGHDFRPDYLFLKTAIQRLRVPVTMALTATATPDVQADILAQLGLAEARTIVTGFDRPNLYLEVHRLASDRHKRERLKELLAELPGCGIIYCGTRKESVETAEFVRSLGRSAEFYSGELDPESRTRIQDGFMRGDVEIICATNAFGLGVNKPDIRFVLHVALTGTVEALYQEMGRAGRDGLPARCALLFSPSDLPLQRFFIQAATPVRRDLEDLYGFLRQRAPEAEFSWNEAAQRMTDASDIRVRATLSELEKAGLARRMADAENGDARVQLLDGANANVEMARRERELDAVRTRRLHKLQAVESYARLTTCRRAYIRRYFGESDVPDTCCACDICAPRTAAAPTVDAPGTQRSEEVGRTLLLCVQRYNGRLGRSTIAQILSGSKAKKIAESEWYAEWHGRLADIPQVRIAEALEELLVSGYVEAGVLTRNESVFPVLQLSPLGWDVVKGRAEAPAVAISRTPPPREASPGAPAPAGAPATPEDQALFDRLRLWRNEVARVNGWPSYVVFADAALREVVAHRPATPEDLLALRGFGPAKVEKFGDAVLDIVNGP